MIAGCGEAEADSGKRNWYVTSEVKKSEASERRAAGFTMVRIESVPEFELGAVAGEGEDKDPGKEDRTQWTAEDKLPVAEFWLSDREVSVAQFRALCPERFDAEGKIDGTEVQDGEPFRDVNWYEALIFCNRLSVAHGMPEYYRMNEGDYDWATGDLKDGAMLPTVIDPKGRGYRLPTEREWEYGCRSLSPVSYSFGEEVDSLSLFARYAKDNPTVCGFQRPSRWGLSDMHGNVWEWCWDLYNATEEQSRSSSRVLRGGSFDYDFPDILRSAIRSYNSPELRYNYFGFRLSRTK
jgi:formylglycine-generating enzyme required for sulfatase activity